MCCSFVRAIHSFFFLKKKTKKSRKMKEKTNGKKFPMKKNEKVETEKKFKKFPKKSCE